MNDLILEMKSIKKTFGPVVALKSVSLKVKKGQIHAICGENGAGKSTLMNVLSGVYPFGTYEGDIVYNSEVCKWNNIKDSETKGIVIVHQELALIPYLSIAENIFMGNELKNKFGAIDWNLTHKKAAEYLEKVGLTENPETKIMDIGVGKQQLVEIAKALAKDVKLLILDEPTAALNDDDSENLLQIIRNLRDTQGVTCIIISHKLNEIADISDEVTIIRDGETIESIQIDEQHPLDEDHLIQGMVGRSLDNRYPEHSFNNIGEEILRIQDWSVYHPEDQNRKVLDSVNIEVKAGEVVGIAGLMGAGRTELAMSVFGHSYGKNISGKVFVKGKERKMKNVKSAISSGLAYASEDRKVYGLNLLRSIRENISLAALEKLTNFGVVHENNEIHVANKYKASMSIKTNNLELPVSSLSGGNQQKVVLSKWMYSDPDILFLDEPTRGIDVGAKYQIYEIIGELADQGKAVVVISSELPELIGICNRIYTVFEGKVTGQIEKKDFSQEALMKLMTNTKGNK